MKLKAEEKEFRTGRRLLYGNEGGVLTITIEAKDQITEEMAKALEDLATEAFEKAKNIVAAQEQPRRWLEGASLGSDD